MNAVEASSPRAKRGNHTWPEVPPPGLMDIPEAFLKKAHLLAITGVSDVTLHARIKTGLFPPPDMRDGSRPLWRVATIRAWLDGSVIAHLDGHIAELVALLKSAPTWELPEIRQRLERLHSQRRRVLHQKPAAIRE